MLGAIVGDIIGSRYENFGTKRKDFRLFAPPSFYTDDTVLTVAVAHAILDGCAYARMIKRYARRHCLRGFGPRFLLWMWLPGARPYHSLGNGSAMRVSPVAHAFANEQTMLAEAEKSAACSHNHPEGIKGAQAVAHAVFLARQGASKPEISAIISSRYGYDLQRKLDDIRPGYHFNMTCPGSVPEAILAFLESTSFEDSIRNAISLGGDADTQAAIAGAIAEPFYHGIPPPILQETGKRLPRRFKNIVVAFYEKCGTPDMLRQAHSL